MGACYDPSMFNSQLLLLALCQTTGHVGCLNASSGECATWPLPEKLETHDVEVRLAAGGNSLFFPETTAAGSLAASGARKR